LGKLLLIDRLRIYGIAVSTHVIIISTSATPTSGLYCAMKLNLPRPNQAAPADTHPSTLVAPASLNQDLGHWTSWPMPLYAGRAFRTLNLSMQGNRQVLGSKSHTRPESGFIRVMEQLIELPAARALRLGQGPEDCDRLHRVVYEAAKHRSRFIQPGKPAIRTRHQRFNKTYRDECSMRTCSKTVEQCARDPETWLHGIQRGAAA